MMKSQSMLASLHVMRAAGCCQAISAAMRTSPQMTETKKLDRSSRDNKSVKIALTAPPLSEGIFSDRATYLSSFCG